MPTLELSKSLLTSLYPKLKERLDSLGEVLTSIIKKATRAVYLLLTRAKV